MLELCAYYNCWTGEMIALVPREAVDRVWANVAALTREGAMGAGAMVSTRALRGAFRSDPYHDVFAEGRLSKRVSAGKEEEEEEEDRWRMVVVLVKDFSRWEANVGEAKRKLVDRCGVSPERVAFVPDICRLLALEEKDFEAFGEQGRNFLSSETMREALLKR